MILSLYTKILQFCPQLETSQSSKTLGPNTMPSKPKPARWKEGGEKYAENIEFLVVPKGSSGVGKRWKSGPIPNFGHYLPCEFQHPYFHLRQLTN